jgi:hypothetical protein
MVDHYAESRTSTHTECGKDVRNVSCYVIGNPPQGVTCKYCLKKLAKRGIVMKADWMLNDSDDKQLYELLTLEDVFADQKIVANFAQRKLLEYIRAKWDMDDDYLTIPIETVTSMLKQLDGK